MVDLMDIPSESLKEQLSEGYCGPSERHGTVTVH